MANIGLQGKLLKSSAVLVITVLVVFFSFVSRERSLKLEFSSKENRTTQEFDPNYSTQILNFLWRQVQLGYQHVWPEMEFGWRIVVGTVIGFFGAAFGSVGGVGGGGTSTKAFFKGVEIWKEETIIKKETVRRLASSGSGGEELEYRPVPGGPNNDPQMESNEATVSEVSIIENIYWKELSILVAVWAIFLALQISKNKTKTCSAAYWVLNLLQVPVAVGASAYQAISLYKGRRVIASNGETRTTWRVHQLVLYCSCGILAGTVGGLLGIGGGFILGPLFLELGIPPQVSSATSTFAMLFSSSMSAVEYYLIKRFPIPYTLYFVGVATIAAFVGQHVVRRIISILGRASLIIFILAFTVFLSAILLGGIGISNMIKMIEEEAYMGFDNLCAY